jgi:lysophospholipase L1-like esterase
MSRALIVVALMTFAVACRPRERRHPLPLPRAAPSYDVRDTDLAERRSGGVYARGLRWIGRADLRSPAVSRFAWSGSGFAARFSGTGLRAELSGDVPGLVVRVEVDGRPARALTLGDAPGSYVLAEDLAPGAHTLVLTRESEGLMGISALHAVHVTGGVLLPPPAPPARFVEVVGDSVSAGYGVLGDSTDCHFSFATESSAATFGGLSARALGAELSNLAVSGHGIFRNLDGALSDTLPALYDRALPGEPHPYWRPARAPDAVVVALGANDLDAARDDPSDAMVEAYTAFVARLRAIYPEALIVCVAGPMLREEGASHTRLRAVITRTLAERARRGDRHLSALAFPLLDTSELGCDWHPNARAQAAMGRLIEAHLREQLGW